MTLDQIKSSKCEYRNEKRRFQKFLKSSVLKHILKFPKQHFPGLSKTGKQLPKVQVF